MHTTYNPQGHQTTVQTRLSDDRILHETLSNELCSLFDNSYSTLSRIRIEEYCAEWYVGKHTLSTYDNYVCCHSGCYGGCAPCIGYLVTDALQVCLWAIQFDRSDYFYCQCVLTQLPAITKSQSSPKFTARRPSVTKSYSFTSGTDAQRIVAEEQRWKANRRRSELAREVDLLLDDSLLKSTAAPSTSSLASGELSGSEAFLTAAAQDAREQEKQQLKFLQVRHRHAPGRTFNFMLTAQLIQPTMKGGLTNFTWLLS